MRCYRPCLRKTSVYIYLVYSTDMWDWYNDEELKLRRAARILRGGLQLATRNMPQGPLITIPMTNNIGYQNLAHVIIHFNTAEPDLGRKGFQPEHVRVAEKLAVSAVTAFRNRKVHLRRPTGEPVFADEIRLDDWIEKQRLHEQDHPLRITGAGLFEPTEELPIRSKPVVEQDVVALFNQMISSGLIRGVKIVSSSQYEQYDALYRIVLEPPFKKYIRSNNNPLGVANNHFAGKEETIISKPKVLEYKYNVDGLVEELQNQTKRAQDIGLVIAWLMGSKWKQLFEVVSYLDEQHADLREFHGCTHHFRDSVTGVGMFHAIILEDLVNYLMDRTAESEKQRKLYSDSDS